MNKQVKNDLRFCIDAIEGQSNADYSKIFQVVFTRSLASKLQTELNITYDKAIVIATMIKIDVQQTVEDDEDVELIDDAANGFAIVMTKLIREFHDDGYCDIEVIKNIASQMSISL